MIKTSSPFFNALQKKLVSKGIRSLLNDICVAIAIAEAEGKQIKMNYRDNPLNSSDLLTVVKNLRSAMY